MKDNKKNMTCEFIEDIIQDIIKANEYLEKEGFVPVNICTCVVYIPSQETDVKKIYSDKKCEKCGGTGFIP